MGENYKAYSFVVPGPLRGYRRPRDANSNYRDYELFKRAVLLLAMEQGFRRTKTTRKAPAKLSVFVSWKGGARSDWSNVFKSIEDSLFEQDRYVVPGNNSGAIWDTKGEEQALVQIEEGIA